MAAPSVPAPVEVGSRNWTSILSVPIEEKGEVTAVEFDESGEHLAIGDKSGHVSLFQKGDGRGYSPLFRFKSHSPTLDPLKSLEIEERINMIKFVRGRSSGMYVLTTNDKVVKLWRLQRKRSTTFRKLSHSPNRMKQALLRRNSRDGIDERTSESKVDGKENNLSSAKMSTSGPTAISMVPPPQLRLHKSDGSTQPHGGASSGRTKSLGSEVKMASSLKREYGGAHTYHIHSISINSDNETFISLDSLRVNLWHLQRDAQRFPIIDIKPKDMANLTEIVTSGTFHPEHCHTLMYTTSRGRMCLHDLRSSAILKEPAKNFEITETAYPTKQFFSEVLTSISDAKFTTGGRYVLCRDYLSLRLWDVNMERKPVEVFPVQDYLSGHLPVLYQNNALFDKFQCAASSDGKSFVTGSYSHRTVIQDRKASALAITAPPFRGNASLPFRSPVKISPSITSLDFSSTKFNEKVLLSAWHPKEDIVAVSGLNRVDVYEKQKVHVESS